MTDNADVLSEEELFAVLNRETARISWHELQPQFARGQVLQVDPGLDLVRVAMALVRDRGETVREWTEHRQLQPVPASTAQTWYDGNTGLWAVVVAPWVLVQATD